MVDTHLSPNLNGAAVFDRDGRQLDVSVHVAGLVVADMTAFTDAQNSVVPFNLHHFSKDGMEVDSDEISHLQQLNRGPRGEIEFLRVAANRMPVNLDDAVLLKLGWRGRERAVLIWAPSLSRHIGTVECFCS